MRGVYQVKCIWINKVYISKITTTIVGTLYALLGFIGTFASLDEIFPDELQMWKKILISLSILLGLWVVCFITVAIIILNKKRFSVTTFNSGNTIYLQYGDLFSINEVFDSNERRNIVIPVNRCFDTIVDNRVISEKTLHGMMLKKIYSTGIYSQASLNQQIQEQLKNQKYELLSDNDKPEGNKKRFPVGTIIDLPGIGNEHYLLWALSSFDNNLKAHTTMQEYVLAVQRLIEACNTESEGFPVLLPLVGTGLSRTKKEQEDVLAYILNAFKLNKCEINCDIHIIVRENLKKEISIKN